MDRFRDVHLHAASVNEWNQTYNQITPGCLQSSLVQISTGHLHVFREYMNQRVVQHGQAPRGKLCFAVPTAMPGTARMQGRKASDNSVFVLQSGEEFMFHMPMDTDMLAITLEYEVFENLLSASMSPSSLDALLKQPVIEVPEDRLNEVRTKLLALFSHAAANPHLIGTPAAEKMLEHSIISALLDLINDPECDKNQRLSSSTQSFIVDKCHHIAMSSGDMPVTILDLCERLHTSPRTIQNSFNAVTQTSPLDYLRSIRLNAVRRLLVSTSAIELGIGQAAANWGFFHLSHFATCYKGLFGELPSQTPRARAAIQSSL
ncbi:AraC family transcriptional regulator [Rugamonas sp. R1(2021)]|jgi:AraC-like DNA-binding protein